MHICVMKLKKQEKVKSIGFWETQFCIVSQEACQFKKKKDTERFNE